MPASQRGSAAPAAPRALETVQVAVDGADRPPDAVAGQHEIADIENMLDVLTTPQSGLERAGEPLRVQNAYLIELVRGRDSKLYWRDDVAACLFSVCWPLVAAGGDRGRGPLVPAVRPVLPGRRSCWLSAA
jgi:hypothetical protein